MEPDCQVGLVWAAVAAHTAVGEVPPAPVASAQFPCALQEPDLHTHCPPFIEKNEAPTQLVLPRELSHFMPGKELERHDD